MLLLSIALIIQLFVLLDPMASFPILMAAHKNKMNVRKIALGAVFFAFLIAIIIALVGPNLFALFGVSLDSFRIAGGVVLLLLGISTINDIQVKTKIDRVDSLVSLIATPLLTGPAIISFITLKALEVGRVSIISNIIIAFLFVGILFYIFSITISRINMKIISITSKVLGLFLAAMGIEMIVTGIKAFM